jgi:hypothetical protein
MPSLHGSCDQPAEPAEKRRGLRAFAHERAGCGIRHAVAAARGQVPAADLDAAIVQAALAKGWVERRAGNGRDAIALCISDLSTGRLRHPVLGSFD